MMSIARAIVPNKKKFYKKVNIKKEIYEDVKLKWRVDGGTRRDENTPNGGKVEADSVRLRVDFTFTVNFLSGTFRQRDVLDGATHRCWTEKLKCEKILAETTF